MSKATDSANKPFTAHGAGTNNGTLEGGVLAPDGGSILIEGYNSISDVIPGINDIRVVTNPEPRVYDYTIQVDGACPSGSFDNAMTFQDCTGNSGGNYSLRIFSSSVEQHTVEYNSDCANIVVITWDI